MDGFSVASMKRGKRCGNWRMYPKDGTRRREIYDALMRDGFVIGPSKEMRIVLYGLMLGYGIETRSVGHGKYVLVGF